MSGYTEQTAGLPGEWDPSSVLLSKPFTRMAILRAVREILERQETSS
jgi:hypothetical protein